MANLEIRNLSKQYRGARGGSVRALESLNLSVAQGESLALVGPSGSGKTTTLRLLAGLEDPDAGTIHLDGVELNGVAAKDRDVAMVFQQHALYPHMTAFENVAFGLRLRKCERSVIQQRVDETAEWLGISDCLGRLPAELSGGQCQRVALARALVRKPKLFLFDEPLSDLDPSMRAQLRSQLFRLRVELGVTTIYVTHDQLEAMILASHIAILDGGRLQQVGTPLEVYQNPVNTFVAGFIGYPPMNLLPGTAFVRGNGTYFEAAAEARGIGGPLPARVKSVPDGAKVLLGVRPEHVHQRPVDSMADSWRFTAKVNWVQVLGHELHVELAAHQQRLIARLPVTSRISEGETLTGWLDVSAATLFDAVTLRALE